MKTKILIGLGLGTLAYWIAKEYKKSDHTVSGTLRSAGQDITKGIGVCRETTQRVVSAIRAGVEDWGEEMMESGYASQTAGVRTPRGNGGAVKGKTSDTGTYSTPTQS